MSYFQLHVFLHPVCQSDCDLNVAYRFSEVNSYNPIYFQHFRDTMAHLICHRRCSNTMLHYRSFVQKTPNGRDDQAARYCLRRTSTYLARSPNLRAYCAWRSRNKGSRASMPFKNVPLFIISVLTTDPNKMPVLPKVST